MDHLVVDKIRRIYAALDQTTTGDLASVPALIEANGEGIGVWQDFTGGLSQPQLSNLLHSLIHNIVNLKDHARKDSKSKGIDPSSIDLIVKNEAYLILCDLSNNDKHGYPPRNGGHSGRSPQILKVNRLLRMTTSGEAGSFTMVKFEPGGLESSGGGVSQVIITADVLDADGAIIGDASEICVDALRLWDEGLKTLGLL